MLPKEATPDTVPRQKTPSWRRVARRGCVSLDPAMQSSLLHQIQQGKHLKRTITNDRSAPLHPPTISDGAGESRGPLSTQEGANIAGALNAMFGALLVRRGAAVPIVLSRTAKAATHRCPHPGSTAPHAATPRAATPRAAATRFPTACAIGYVTG